MKGLKVYRQRDKTLGAFKEEPPARLCSMGSNSLLSKSSFHNGSLLSSVKRPPLDLLRYRPVTASESLLQSPKILDLIEPWQRWVSFQHSGERSNTHRVLKKLKNVKVGL